MPPWIKSEESHDLLPTNMSHISIAVISQYWRGVCEEMSSILSLDHPIELLMGHSFREDVQYKNLLGLSHVASVINVSKVKDKK